MRRLASGTAVLLGLLLSVAGTASAQRLDGRVVDTHSGDGVAAATVRLLSAADSVVASATARADGTFTLHAPRAGRYRVGVSAAGYAAHESGTVEIGAGEAATIVLRVLPAAVPLDPLDVEVRAEARVPYLARSGFYDRQRVETGRFFERAEIEASNPRQFVDLLRGIAGVRIMQSGNVADVALRGGLASSVGMRSAGEVCAPEIYLDGMLISRGGAVTGRDQRFNLNEIRVADLDAVEVYASAARVPARFGGAHAACGVVLLWSRS